VAVARARSGLIAAGAAIAIAGAVVALASPTMTMRAVAAGLVVLGASLALAGRGDAAPLAPILPDEESRQMLVTVSDQARRIAAGEPMTVTEGHDTLAALHGLEQRIEQAMSARARIVATERDLDQARRMYRQILPLSSATEHGPLAVAGSCAPAAETGGDWWIYRKLSGGRLLVVIGDATGHGVHSAMVGCMAHGAMRALTQLGDDALQPRRVLDAVHTAIKIPGVEHAPMTLFSALLDPGKRQVQYVNRGHVFPLVARRDASGTIVEVTSITGDLPEDEVDDSIDLEIRSGTAPLEPGQVLICFTDGLIERANQNGRPFGVRRLQQALLGAVVPPTTDGLVGLRDRILQKTDEYVGGAPLEDDITLVLCGVAGARG
jgi:sigma-B regulation protein RsbU (phosphoserine phosphatase)